MNYPKNESPNSENSDLLIIVYLAAIILFALIQAGIHAFINDWYTNTTVRYISTSLYIISGLFPMLLAFAIKNNTIKIIGIILASLYAIYVIAVNIKFLTVSF